MTPKEKAKVILHKHLYWYPPIEGIDEQLKKKQSNRVCYNNSRRNHTRLFFL
jgi:hypothetical protein